MGWWKWWWQDYNEMYNVADSTTGIERYEPSKPVYEYSQFSGHMKVVCLRSLLLFRPGH